MASAVRNGNSPSPGELCRHSPSRSEIASATSPTPASTAWATSRARGAAAGARSFTLRPRYCVMPAFFTASALRTESASNIALNSASGR